MSRWQVVKELFGLASFALIPFGVFSYLYSSRLLTDLDALPDEVIRGFFLYSDDMEALESQLASIRLYSAVVMAIGVTLLLIYVVNYLKNPEIYEGVYQRRVALFGAVAGLLWMAAIAWWGYLPASSAVAEYKVIAEHNPGVVEGILSRGTSHYEIAVFDRAATGAGIALGFVWWSISVVSLVVPPESDEGDSDSIWGSSDSYISMRRKNVNRDGSKEEKKILSYCPSCGSGLTNSNLRAGVCSECGEELE